ncbi:MFS transporter [Ancrocorticia populi]|uniref:MFS transporter n=1 Tax=Ancrocorticia populi TaxID=2175228 RepID=UPI0023575249|nr:MFS transporter [Ancrocorticia populi]
MRSDRSSSVLPILYIAAFVAGFNENIINVALVDIMAEFGISAATAQWLVTGYMMVTTVVVAISAFLYRRLGLRKLFFIGATLLSLGSLCAIFAPTFPLLLLCRLVQAVGTGIFIPTMMSTVLMVAPRKKIGFYLSIGGMMITFGPAFGPVISGLMVTAFGWNTIFVPVLVVIVVLGACGVVVVKNVGETEAVKLDVLSVILIAVGLVAFVYGLSEITVRPGVAAGSAAAGLVFLAIFVRRQFKVDNPVLNLRPMASIRFWPAAILVVVAMMTTFSLSVLLPLYFQRSFGMSALAAGALLLAPILVNAATAVMGGKIMDARGAWPLLITGFGVIVLGQILIVFVAPQLSWIGVLGASVLSFGGVGLVLSPSQTAGLATLSKPDHPHGVAILNTFIQMAAAIGPSLLIGILSSQAASSESAGASAAQANADGFTRAILVAAIIALVGAAVAFFYTRMLAGERKSASVEGAEGPEGVQAAQDQSASEPTIASLMRTEVFSVPATATVGEVVTQFVSSRTAGLPVIDDQGGVCGYITDGEILRAVSGRSESAIDLAFGLQVYRDDANLRDRVTEVMQQGVMELASKSVVTVDADSSVEDVAAILGERSINKAPVMSGETLVGVITRGDLVRSIFGRLLGRVDASILTEAELVTLQ